MLLSALVLPGLGQLASGRLWRGLFFSASSLALVVAVVGRVMQETQRLMPADPEALLDPPCPSARGQDPPRERVASSSEDPRNHRAVGRLDCGLHTPRRQPDPGSTLIPRPLIRPPGRG